MIVYNNSKEPISLGKEFARGGEGAVYEIDDTSVAKIYFEPEGRLDKMNAFIKKTCPFRVYALRNNCCSMKEIDL